MAHIECWLGSFVISQGIRTSFAKKFFILYFCDFSWGGGGDPDPCPPSGSAPAIYINKSFQYSLYILRKSQTTSLYLHILLHVLQHVTCRLEQAELDPYLSLIAIDLNVVP